MKRPDRSRPPGYAARGTSAGLLGLIGLSGLIPTVAIMSLFPVYTNGIDLLVASLPYIVGISFAFILIVALGLRKKQLWYVYFMFGSGCLLLVLYLLGFLLGMMVLFRLIPLQAPDLYVVSYYTGFWWLLNGILAWWSFRMIRLRYWQPWTTPEQWEIGNETGPSWAERLVKRWFR